MKLANSGGSFCHEQTPEAPHSARVLTQWVDAYARERGTLRYHVAQKIHGMTQPPRGDDAPNERYRDLADLLLMRELAHDMSGIREACVDVFALRGTHTWPPDFEAPTFWEEPFGRLAADVGLAAGTLAQAATEANEFITSIDAAPAR